jgi:uncharacterized protein YheU (UPF0270 family)
MQIPIEILQQETLTAVIESFILRGDPDEGHSEFTLEHKTAQVLRQLKSGKAVLVFDAKTESCNIILVEHANQRVEFQKESRNTYDLGFPVTDPVDPVTDDWTLSRDPEFP